MHICLLVNRSTRTGRVASGFSKVWIGIFKINKIKIENLQ